MKRNIDKFIECNYDKLLNIVKKKITYFKRDICPYEMFSYCYMYVVENPPEVKEDIPKYFVKYCNTELMHHNSVTNQRIRKHNHLEFFEWSTFDTAHENALDHIDIERCLDDFVKKLDRVDQIIWNVMIQKDKRRLWELSNHFDIPQSTINLYRVRILNNFKQHYNEYFNDED